MDEKRQGQTKQELKANFDVFDLHLSKCAFKLYNGAIYDTSTLNDDGGYMRVIRCAYRQFRPYEEGLFWLTLPWFILKSGWLGAKYGPYQPFPDPTVIYPTGKCSFCGIEYGYPDKSRFFLRSFEESNSKT